MRKRFIILLTSLLGISTILVYLLIGAFLFQKDLLFPKVQASPATCTVDDDLVINGTVGIGINSPANIFHIQTDQDWPRIILESTGFPANPTAELNLLAEDAAGITQEMNIYHTAGSGMGIWTSYADFVFVILPNGNVGIGTTGPNQKLEVDGMARLGGLEFRKDATNPWQDAWLGAVTFNDYTPANPALHIGGITGADGTRRTAFFGETRFHNGVRIDGDLNVGGNLGLKVQNITCSNGAGCDIWADPVNVGAECPSGYTLTGCASYCRDTDGLDKCGVYDLAGDYCAASCSDSIGMSCNDLEIRLVCMRITDIGD